MKQLKPITENAKWAEHVKYIPMLKSVVVLGPGSFIFILYLNLTQICIGSCRIPVRIHTTDLMLANYSLGANYEQ